MKNVYKFLFLLFFNEIYSQEYKEEEHFEYNGEHMPLCCEVMLEVLSKSHSLSSIEKCLFCEWCKKEAFINLGKVVKELGEKSSREIADLFMEHGIYVNDLNDLGELSLIYSCENLKIEAINFFISLGAEVNKKDKIGRTALSSAITSTRGNEESKNEVVKILLYTKANPDLIDDIIGYTPLMHATKRNLKDVVYTLLIHGADPFKKDNEDRDFFHHAAWTPKILEIYEKYKKEVEAKVAAESGR